MQSVGLTDSALTSARLRRLTLALALGLVLGFVLYLVIGQREESAFYRGDFPAFYAAAEILWSGRGDQLYDLNLQSELENRHWPDFKGDFFIFAYPPFFALLLASAWYVRGSDRRLVLAPALVLLLSPQTLFYDLAIAIFFLFQGLRPGNHQDFLILAAIWLYGFIALMMRDTQTFPLCAPLLVAVLWLTWHRARSSIQKSPPSGIG